jgi:hypothetical protein
MLSPDAIVEQFHEEWIRSDLPAVMPEPQVIANGQRVELTSLVSTRSTKASATLTGRSLCSRRSATRTARSSN